MLRLEIGVTQSTSTSAHALPVQTADCTLQTLHPPTMLKEYRDNRPYSLCVYVAQVFLQAHASGLVES